MKLAFKENIHTFVPVVTDPRRTHSDSDKPITLRGPVVRSRPTAKNYATGTVGFFLIAFVAGLAMADLSLKMWGLDAFTYDTGRLFIFWTIALFVLLDAFHNSPIFGFLSLFPPFLLFYGMVMSESSILRGVVYGMVIWFGLEVLILPGHSFMAVTNRFVGGVIQDGHHWLNTANR